MSGPGPRDACPCGAGERRVAAGTLSRQELSALPPELGADLGAEISEFAHADRENCSEK